MRTEQEVINHVLSYAKSVPDIQAVIRTNLVPIRKYLFSYEFYFIVKNIEDFEADETFEQCFGERILLYRGDRNYPDMLDGMKAHLMVYKDGITLVINVITDEKFREKYVKKNTQNAWISGTYEVLLDKNREYTDVGKAEEELSFYEIPTVKDFEGCCGEFYWVLKTYAEYVLRKEIPAAMFYLNLSVRDVVNRMIRWYICLQNGKPVDLGILDSYMENFLPGDMWACYCETYTCAEETSMWKALDAMMAVFHMAGEKVAAWIDTAFPDKQERDMREFIKNLKCLEGRLALRSDQSH